MTAVSPRTQAVRSFRSARRRAQRVPVRRRNLERTIMIVSPILVLGLWELCAYLRLVDTRFFPAPSSIAVAFWQSLVNGLLVANVAASVSRILIGFVIGAIPAIVLGITMGQMPLVRSFFQPLIDATFPIPKLALLPLLILVFGPNEPSKYAIIAITVFYLVLANTAAGVRNIDKAYLDVARNAGASRWLVFWGVALPGAAPMILTGVRLALNVALLIIVATEFVGATSGVGYMIWNSWQIFQVDLMYVGLVTTAILGILIALVITLLEKILVPWKTYDVNS